VTPPEVDEGDEGSDAGTPESMPSLRDKDTISENELTYMMNDVVDAPGEDEQESMMTGYLRVSPEEKRRHTSFDCVMEKPPLYLTGKTANALRLYNLHVHVKSRIWRWYVQKEDALKLYRERHLVSQLAKCVTRQTVIIMREGVYRWRESATKPEREGIISPWTRTTGAHVWLNRVKIPLRVTL
jgi:hypothetical protein